MAMRPAPSSAPSSAAIAAASQVGAGVQSASVKARTDPAAAMIPALRAAYEPGRLSVRSVGALGWARTAAAVVSVDPLSTTSTSYGGAPRWAVKASRHSPMTRAPSRTGTTTDTAGSAAMARSVGTAVSDQLAARWAGRLTAGDGQLPVGDLNVCDHDAVWSSAPPPVPTPGSIWVSSNHSFHE